MLNKEKYEQNFHSAESKKKIALKKFLKKKKKNIDFITVDYTNRATLMDTMGDVKAVILP